MSNSDEPQGMSRNPWAQSVSAIHGRVAERVAEISAAASSRKR
jgi:hypothetical protein